MGFFSKYIGRANLDNRETHPNRPRERTDMPKNNKKIRREVTINGTNVWITADTEQDYVNKIQRLLAVPDKPIGMKHRFDDYAERWFEVFSRPNISEVTAVSYMQQLRCHLLPVLGDMFVEDITAADIQRVFNQMGDVASQQTKSKAKNVLNQILKMAVEERIIDYNPLQSTTLRIKGTTSVSTEPYSIAEMRYFVNHLDDIEDLTDRAWLALSVSLPLRPEEVLGLRWCDIDQYNLVLRVRSTVTHPTRNYGQFKAYTKTEASVRDLAIPEWLLRYLPEQGNPEEFVVGGWTPLSYTRLRRLRTRIARQIGYDGVITPRRFRTTVATDISAMTHDLKLVQRMLGHATPQMTLKHYDKGRSTAVDATDAISKCYGF